MERAIRMSLTGCSLFGELDAKALDELTGLCTTREYASRQTVFLQGDPGDALYGVISGQIRVGVTSEDGREVFLNLIEPGEVVGEIALLDGGVRTASAHAVVPTLVYIIQRVQFEQFLEHNPRVSIALLRLLCERVRWTSRQVEDAAFSPLPVRLASRLQALARLGEGEARISQLELARFLNVSRQVVNGYLQEWQRAGYVDVGRGRVVVHDLSQVS